MKPAFLTVRQVSERLGCSPSTFREKRDSMIRDGFPPKDAIMNAYPAAAVEDWIARRSRIAPDGVTVEGSRTGVNLDAL